MLKKLQDDMDFLYDPYELLKIKKYSSDQTIKDAYKLILKTTADKESKKILKKAYNLIKTEALRRRFDLLSPPPLFALKEVSQRLNNTPHFTGSGPWLELITSKDY